MAVKKDFKVSRKADAMTILLSSTMENVEIEVFFSGIQTKENIDMIEYTLNEGNVVWIFDPGTNDIIELVTE